MTIMEFVVKQPSDKGINWWIDLIKAERLDQYERIIIDCACSLDKIAINHTAYFDTFTTKGA